MKLLQSLNDFIVKHIELDTPEKDVFNVLRSKSTRLTTPSVVAFMNGDLNNTDSWRITSVFISDNPSELFTEENDQLQNIDHILIYTNDNLENPLITIKEKQEVYKIYQGIIDRVKRYSSIYNSEAK